MYFPTTEHVEEKPSIGALLTLKVEYPVTCPVATRISNTHNGRATIFVLQYNNNNNVILKVIYEYISSRPHSKK
jgi:hypothetical protein